MKKIIMASLIGFMVGLLTLTVTGVLNRNAAGDPPAKDVLGVHATPVLAATDNVPARGIGFAPIVKKVRPAVVKVSTKILVESRRSPFGDDFFDRFFNVPRQQQSRPVEGIGSGFFISADGYIITNHHVVKDAINITIETIDKKKYKAKKIGDDSKTDLALLKIDGTDHPFLEFGDADKAEVGEWVLAIGNPLYQDLTVTSGIISAKGREMAGLYQSGLTYQDFIQTDAAINQGNSGGPLINMQGQVIGINSVIVSNSGGSIGLGFAITSNLARRVVTDLKKSGRVVRGWLGVSILEMDEERAEIYDMKPGILVQSVEPGSPAEKAGLKKLDFIVSMNGKPVEESRTLRNTVAGIKPGEKLTIGVLRDEKPMTFTVIVGEAPETETILARDGDGGLINLGMTLTDNNSEEAARRKLKTDEGIIVTDVTRGGAAYQQGIRANDVIIGLNRTAVKSVKQFRELIGKRAPGKGVYLYIDRNGDDKVVPFIIPEE